MTKPTIQVGDVVHLHATEEYLSDVYVDALSEHGSRGADKMLEKLSDRTLRWKVSSIETARDGTVLADIAPVGFKCSPCSMFLVEHLVPA